MRRVLMLFSAVSLLASASGGVAQAQKLDANGRCHAANGQFAKAEVCGGAGSLRTAGLDANGRCRDASGHFAKADVCGAGGSAMAKAGTSRTIAPAAVAPPERAKVPERCKNDKGKFAKCGSPGAHPA